MLFDIILTILSLAFILAACAIFTNGIEWLGMKLQLNQGVVGSIFAAVGTALPETIIPIVAILFSSGSQAHDIGIGAIAGAPFMLGTLAFFITGLSVIIYALSGRRSLMMNVDAGIFSKDLTFFIIIYGIAVSTTFVHVMAIRTIISVALLLSYGLYVRLLIYEDCDKCSIQEPLFLSRFFNVRARLTWISVQLILGMAGIVYGAHLFVNYTERLSQILGVAPLILSMLITPIATELPEKLNSVIWTGKGKDTLAIGNITGSMVFQSCFPVVFGILFTPWDLRGITMFSAVLALSSAALNLVLVRITRKVNPFALLFSGVLYVIFIVYVLFIPK